jgi:endoribonuclease Dicer
MGTDLWNKELWENHFANNMVIVCTAEILYQCLFHSFIKMDQINLLIFDEAHHAKKNHSYARIIKDFYDEEENRANLPKIFGMTASPVDARTDVGKAAAELEKLLHCQILTASDASMLQYATKKKHELIAEYGDLRLPFETPLHRKLHALLNGISECLATLKFAKEASSELGPWCTDQIWKYALTGEDVKKLKAKTESNFTSKSARTGEPLSKLDEHLIRIDQAQRIVEAHNFEDPELTTGYVSSKVIKLAEYLQERFERTTDDKCIVFVQQRYTARLLADLFSRPGIGTPHLRVDSLVSRCFLLAILSFKVYSTSCLTIY